MNQVRVGADRAECFEYAGLMSTNPFATNFVTGACLAGLGDVLCQKMVLRRAGSGELFDDRNWDARRRTLNIFLIRACIIVPFIMFWYARMGQISPGDDMAQRIQRVLLNEAVGGGAHDHSRFVDNTILRDEWSLSGLQQRFHDEFHPTLKKGVTYWPFCTCSAPSAFTSNTSHCSPTWPTCTGTESSASTPTRSRTTESNL